MKPAIAHEQEFPIFGVHWGVPTMTTLEDEFGVSQRNEAIEERFGLGSHSIHVEGSHKY
jgi:hypothetical protein